MEMSRAPAFHSAGVTRRATADEIRRQPEYQYLMSWGSLYPADEWRRQKRPNTAVGGNQSFSRPNTALAGYQFSSRPNTAIAGNQFSNRPNTAIAGNQFSNRPNTAIAGNQFSSRPNTAIAGNQSPSRPNTAAAENIFFSRRDTAVGGNQFPCRPNTAIAGNQFFSRPNTAAARNQSSCRPNTALAGNQFSSRPNTAIGGNQFFSRPNTAAARNQSSCRPNTALAGNQFSSRPNTAIAGNQSPSRPNTAAARNQSSCRPNTALAGNQFSSRPNTAIAGNQSPSRPNTALAENQSPSRPNTAAAENIFSSRRDTAVGGNQFPSRPNTAAARNQSSCRPNTAVAGKQSSYKLNSNTAAVGKQSSNRQQRPLSRTFSRSSIADVTENFDELELRESKKERFGDTKYGKLFLSLGREKNVPARKREENLARGSAACSRLKENGAAVTAESVYKHIMHLFENSNPVVNMDARETFCVTLPQKAFLSQHKHSAPRESTISFVDSSHEHSEVKEGIHPTPNVSDSCSAESESISADGPTRSTPHEKSCGTNFCHVGEKDSMKMGESCIERVGEAVLGEKVCSESVPSKCNEFIENLTVENQECCGSILSECNKEREFPEKSCMLQDKTKNVQTHHIEETTENMYKQSRIFKKYKHKFNCRKPKRVKTVLNKSAAEETGIERKTFQQRRVRSAMDNRKPTFDADLEKCKTYLRAQSRTFTQTSQYMANSKRGLSQLSVHYSQTNTSFNDRVIMADLLRNGHTRNAIIGDGVYAMERRLYNKRRDPMKSTTFYDRFLKPSPNSKTSKYGGSPSMLNRKSRTVAERAKERQERIIRKNEELDRVFPPRAWSLIELGVEDIKHMLNTCRYLRIDTRKQPNVYGNVGLL